MDRVKQYAKLLIIFLLVLAFIVGIGYFFAHQKSEPIYLSKIDKLMFDNKNKAPYFILTLPDYEKNKEVVIENTDTDTDTETEIEAKTEKAEKNIPQETQDLKMEDVLSNIPSLNKLSTFEPSFSLKNITLDDDLTEDNKSLRLPKIANNGRKPWFEYGQPLKIAPNFKKVAIVIKNVGFDETAIEAINKSFPSEVSIALTPYGQDLGNKILDLRKRGHETYIDMLLPSKDFLKSDSGPMAMSLTINAQESIDRLHQTIAVGAPFGGVVVNDGIADESNAEILNLILQDLKKHGLLMIDASAGDGIENIKVNGLARRRAEIVIEGNYNHQYIKDALKKAENIAMMNGQVLVVIEPKPVILMEVNRWIKTFSPQVSYEESKNMEIAKPLALVPASNLVVE